MAKPATRREKAKAGTKRVDGFDLEQWAGEQRADPAEIRLLKQRIGQLERKLHDARGGTALVLDAIREVLKDPPPLTLPPRPPRDRRKRREEVCVVHVSDTQIGKVTKSYNGTVAADRPLLLAEKALKATEDRRRSARIDSCRVYLGGDLVEGEEIFPHQVWEVESDLGVQAMQTAPDAIARLILRLLEGFRSVRVLGVVGNHGRNGSRGSRSSPGTNWDRIAMEATRLRLASVAPADRLTWQLPDDANDWFSLDNVLGWSCLLIHGHQVRGGFAGYPWYAVGRRAGGWSAAVRGWASEGDRWRRYLFLGHFHTFAVATLNNVVMLANGTTESDNEYARSELASAGEPCQRVAFFDEEHGLVADHQVFLTEV